MATKSAQSNAGSAGAAVALLVWREAGTESGVKVAPGWDAGGQDAQGMARASPNTPELVSPTLKMLEDFSTI